MDIRRFNTDGMNRFSQYLDTLTTEHPESFPELLLANEEFSESVGSNTSKLDSINLDDKLEAATVLDEIVNETGIDSAERDAGFWTWISCYLFRRLCNQSSGKYKPGQRAKWIAEPANYQRYYRHLLASNWLIYRAHTDDPERTRALLSGPVNTPGEIFEQIASRLELVRSPVIMGLTRILYWDDKNKRRRKGSGGKGEGSSRRLADILNQYERTWDLYSMQADELASMLPSEFERFRNI
jgi:hypothetical protein